MKKSINEFTKTIFKFATIEATTYFVNNDFLDL